MCRGADLGVCCAQGCDTRIRCQDAGGYCDAHNPYDFTLCYCEDECDCVTRPPRPVDDPEKRRVYSLRNVERGIKAAEAAIETQEKRLADLLVMHERLRNPSSEAVSS